MPSHVQWSTMSLEVVKLHDDLLSVWFSPHCLFGIFMPVGAPARGWSVSNLMSAWDERPNMKMQVCPRLESEDTKISYPPEQIQVSHQECRQRCCVCNAEPLVTEFVVFDLAEEIAERGRHELGGGGGLLGDRKRGEYIQYGRGQGSLGVL